jgi:hypothetical protein
MSSRVAVCTVLASTVLAVTGVLMAGCGSRTAAGPEPAAAPAPPLASSLASTSGTGWAIVEMGGSAAVEENFWELFVRPPGTAKWRLATPVGVADNGGLVVASTSGGPVVTGFRPSQDLTFSPLAATRDGGAKWSPAGLVDPGLAGLPDALAAGPDHRLIALTRGGGAELGRRLGAAWTHLSSTKALAATPAGQACGLARLTAAAFSGSGAPLLAASCGRPGISGIFTRQGAAWRAAGPAMPASLAREDIEVLRLVSTGSAEVALLRAGTGPDASLVAAWSGDSGGQWSLSAPLRVGARQLNTTAVGPGGAVGAILSPGHGVTLAGPGASWRVLPPLPRWAAALALGPARQADVIAAHGGTFWDWRLAPGSAGWSLAQKMHVTIPYGSSS